MVESIGENAVTSHLKLSVRDEDEDEEEEEEEEEEKKGSLTVPGNVERKKRLVCRTNQSYLDLDTRDVNLSLKLTTNSRTTQHFNLTVSLESNRFNWTEIPDTRYG